MKASLKYVLTAITLCLPISAHAYTVIIDEFNVTRNGSPLFLDNFGDGSAPPIAPAFNSGNPASYFVRGTMGPETGGKLTMDSSGAEQTTGAIGVLVDVQLARLLTNVNPATPTQGLRADDSFSVSGLFDLSLPGAARRAYGVRFNDAAAGNTADDIVELMVLRQANNELWVHFRHLDFVNGTSTLIERVALETTHDQIELTLAKVDPMLDAITASLTYVDSGTAGSPITFGTTQDIFSNEDFTRAEFISRAAVVPLPAAVWLFSSGLLGFVSFARRRT